MVRSGSRTVAVDRLVLARWSTLLDAALEEMEEYSLDSAALVDGVMSEIDDALGEGEDDPAPVQLSEG